MKQITNLSNIISILDITQSLFPFFLMKIIVSKKNLGQCSKKENYHIEEDDDIHVIFEYSSFSNQRDK